MLTDDLTGDYVIDPRRSRIGFTARHAVITKVRGIFTEIEGTAYLDVADPSSSTAELTVDVASVDTGNASRDSELRTNAFLDAPNHPAIEFASTLVEQVDARTYDLSGDLTIKATTLPITVRFRLVETGTDEDGRGTLTFSGTVGLNRRDWKVEWPPPLETGGVLVGDKIGLDITVVAVSAE